MKDSLKKHIVDSDIQSKERLEILMNQMLAKNPIDKSLKDTDPLKSFLDSLTFLYLIIKENCNIF